MYKVPSSQNNREHEQRLREAIVYYGLVSGLFIGYVGYGLDATIGLIQPGRGLLLLLLLVGAFMLMYAPFFRTTTLNLVDWANHVKKLVLGLGAALLLGIAWFVRQGVGFPNWLGVLVIGLAMLISVRSSLQFLKSRLEVQW